MIHWAWLILAAAIFGFLGNWFGFKDGYEHGKNDMLTKIAKEEWKKLVTKRKK